MESIRTSAVRAAAPPSAADRARGRRMTAAVFVTVALANVVAIVWLWVHGGNVAEVNTAGEALTSAARLTGLLGAYLALVQLVLLARVPWLERLVGFDRLSLWHRWNGHLCLDLVLAHVVLSIWGYAVLDRLSLGAELSTMLAGGVYPGMITATIGTVLLVAVAVSSVVVVRRRLRYEAWYVVHLTAYLAIALAWFHQIPTGNELVLDPVAAWYWRLLFLGTFAVLLGFRVAVPLVNAFRYRLRVSSVEEIAPGVVSLTIEGRGIARLDARAGQFFLWRFLTRDRWWAAHPFSLSEAPRVDRLRITVKALGDFTGSIGDVAPGTRVLAEGPFGVFTSDARRLDKAVLIGGGIGITPVRALMEEMPGDVIVLYRVVREDDAIFLDELEDLARRRCITVHVLPGDHRADADPLAPEKLRELVPDIDERDVFICGPPAMTSTVERNVRRANVERRRIHTERFAY